MTEYDAEIEQKKEKLRNLYRWQGFTAENSLFMWISIPFVFIFDVVLIIRFKMIVIGIVLIGVLGCLMVIAYIGKCSFQKKIRDTENEIKRLERLRQETEEQMRILELKQSERTWIKK